VLNRVLLLSASSGAGHVRAAQALEKAFAQSGTAREVRHIDSLQYTNKLFRNLYSRAYLEMVNRMPDVMGWLYDQMDKPWKNERRRLALDKLNTRPFVKMLREYQPDLVVSTHFLPAEIISWLKAKERLTTRQAIVVTDFDVHAMWLVHHYEHYFVAMDETREHLIRLGIAPSKITVSGIPIDPVFSQSKGKHAMRERHGLLQDRTTILVSAGGFGVGPIKNLVSSLLELRHPAQIVAICGRNDKLRREMDRVAAASQQHDKVAIKVIGFTTEIDEYMAASDILVGKPGGLTTSESLARGLVTVIVNPIPGQEERNSDHLLEEGAALRCNNLPVLAYKIDRLLDDPDRFERMRERSLALAKPDAATQIVERVVAMT
jgi:processive 1,2-diacylglycerol beta-glucosyltransferase